MWFKEKESSGKRHINVHHGSKQDKEEFVLLSIVDALIDSVTSEDLFSQYSSYISSMSLSFLHVFLRLVIIFSACRDIVIWMSFVLSLFVFRCITFRFSFLFFVFVFIFFFLADPSSTLASKISDSTDTSGMIVSTLFVQMTKDRENERE